MAQREAAQSQGSSEDAKDNNAQAEAFYQKLMAEYGRNYSECLETITAKLQENPVPDLAEAESSPQQLNVAIALDSSGSMAADANGEPRLTAAKLATTDFVEALPDAAQVSLIAFGHKGSNSDADQAVSCKGIETVYPLAAKDTNRFQTAVNSFKPTGYTPLADTLKLAGETLAAFVDEKTQNIVYLVSDGIETCDGDPVAIAKKLSESGTKIIINVIGFDVDNVAQKQLKSIANAGGGQYYSVKDRFELQKIWQKNSRELARYKLANTRSKNDVFVALTRAKNDVFVCMSRKKTKESTDISRLLIKLSIDKDPNSKYSKYVREKMSQRHARIAQWRDTLTADIKNKRDITIEKLKQDLEVVEKKYEQ